MTNPINLPEIADEAYYRLELDKIEQLSFNRPLTQEEQAYQNFLTKTLLGIVAVRKAKVLLKEQTQRVDKKDVKRKRREVSRHWKASEDWVNEKLCLKREGHMRRGVSCPDGVNEVLSVDTTDTNGLKWLDKELSDAETHATQSRTPVVVAMLKYKDRRDGIVALRFKHFQELYGGK